MEGIKNIRYREENDHLEDDSFLIGTVNLRQQMSSKKSTYTWKRPIDHIRQYSTLYFLILSIAFVGLFVCEMKYKHRMQQTDRTYFVQHFSNGIPPSNMANNQLQQTESASTNLKKQQPNRERLTEQNLLVSQPLTANEQVKPQDLTSTSVNQKEQNQANTESKKHGNQKRSQEQQEHQQKLLLIKKKKDAAGKLSNPLKKQFKQFLEKMRLKQNKKSGVESQETKISNSKQIQDKIVNSEKVVGQKNPENLKSPVVRAQKGK